MAITGLPVFDSTLHATNRWLSQIMEQLGWDDRHDAYHALRAVLHVLRDRLPVDEVVALSAQLPLLIRGIYFEGWHPAGKPNKERTKEAFLAHVSTFYRNNPSADLEIIVGAVLSVLEEHVTSGEIESIRRILPRELQTIFPPQQ